MLCGFGFYPLMALSTCNHTHEVYYEDHNYGRQPRRQSNRYSKRKICQRRSNKRAILGNAQNIGIIKKQSKKGGGGKQLMWGFGGGLMFLGPLFMILIVVAIYFIITSSTRGSTHVHYRQHYPVQDHFRVREGQLRYLMKGLPKARLLANNSYRCARQWKRPNFSAFFFS